MGFVKRPTYARYKCRVLQFIMRTLHLILIFSSSVAAVVDDTYYKLLEIPTTATKTQIKSAYRKLALKYHPDQNKTAGAAEKFIQISQAYEILSNDERKEYYDRFGREGFEHQEQRQQDRRRSHEETGGRCWWKALVWAGLVYASIYTFWRKREKLMKKCKLRLRDVEKVTASNTHSGTHVANIFGASGSVWSSKHSRNTIKIQFKVSVDKINCVRIIWGSDEIPKPIKLIVKSTNTSKNVVFYDDSEAYMYRKSGSGVSRRHWSEFRIDGESQCSGIVLEMGELQGDSDSAEVVIRELGIQVEIEDTGCGGPPYGAGSSVNTSKASKNDEGILNNIGKIVFMMAVVCYFYIVDFEL